MRGQPTQLRLLVPIAGYVRETEPVPPFDELRADGCKSPDGAKCFIAAPNDDPVCHVGHLFDRGKIGRGGIEGINVFFQLWFDFEKAAEDFYG